MPSEPATEEPDLELGRRIRELRKAKGVLLRDAATAAGVSESFLSQVERGLANPSVATLRRIAGALREPVAALFVGDPSVGDVVRASARRRMAHPASSDSLLTPPSARKLQIIQSVVAPGHGSGDEPYTHPGDEECVVVLSGSLEVTVGPDTHSLASGDSLLIDPQTEHEFHNAGSVDAVVLWVMTPSMY